MADNLVDLAAGGPFSTPANDTTGTVTPAYADKVAASGGTIAAGTVATLLLGLLVAVGVKNGRVKLGWAVLSMALGVLLAGTIFGTLSEQLSGTVVSSLNTILSSL